VRIARWLGSHGLHAPAILAAAPDRGLLLLEDLGELSAAAALASGSDEPMLYRLATDILLHWQAAPPPGELPPMDEAALVALLELFLDHAVPGVPDAARALFRALWHQAIGPAMLGTPCFLYRDFHAENLMWCPRESGLRRLGLIDFQDAHVGPRLYDVASLVDDARRDLAPAVRRAVVARWREANPAHTGAAVDAALAVLSAQRATRILGVVARLRERGRAFPEGLEQRVVGHLGAALRHPALRELAAWYACHYTAVGRSG
jgi:aminoglycoside/choline kinase family phosphotransferase